jgi:hypothetical protein
VRWRKVPEESNRLATTGDDLPPIVTGGISKGLGIFAVESASKRL